MNVRITTFTNPFSFFCTLEQFGESDDYITQIAEEFKYITSTSNNITTLNHDQYVAVMWNSKWARGVVLLESWLVIWLIDYGVYFRPSDKTILLNLPSKFQKLPTKIFEASIHGVVPLDKVLNEEFRIINQITTYWTPGSIELAELLIKKATKVLFKPIALLSTQHKDVVIADLFLDIPGKGIVNLVDELDSWPIFVERNKELYFENLSKFYTQKSHHACKLKPNIPINLTHITLQSSLEDYLAIVTSPKAGSSCANESTLDESTILDDATTLVEITGQGEDKSKNKITPEDIEKYSNRYIILNGCEHNVLTILINKAQDLDICERYKDHDLKSIGRGITHRSCKNK